MWQSWCERIFFYFFIVMIATDNKVFWVLNLNSPWARQHTDRQYRARACFTKRKKGREGKTRKKTPANNRRSKLGQSSQLNCCLNGFNRLWKICLVFCYRYGAISQVGTTNTERDLPIATVINFVRRWHGFSACRHHRLVLCTGSGGQSQISRALPEYRLHVHVM